MIKRTNSGANWIHANTKMDFDSGNDEWLEFDAVSGLSTSDYADPTTSGFTLKTSQSAANASGSSYIFWAIAAP
jgi:hypothetical protein